MKNFMFALLAIMPLTVASAETLTYRNFISSENVKNHIEQFKYRFEVNKYEGIPFGGDLKMDNVPGIIIDGDVIRSTAGYEEFPEPAVYPLMNGKVVKCSGIQERCLVIPDVLKLYLPNNDFYEAKRSWTWEGCNFRSFLRVKQSILNQEVDVVIIDSYCPEHSFYQFSRFSYAPDLGVVHIGIVSENEAIDFYLGERRGFLSQSAGTE
ncbi:hypothetical protein [Pseudidiomarina mangrovi]|uniref:hypothetical protein n=1 Tax=Pseudidiomarina mangrovi TaxID=2487133 RepID=UPI000FCAC0AB|nr:hypothetical protein [Pseudidiomarina mangrovi]